MQQQRAVPLSVLIAYARKDELWFQQLKPHLSPLEREGLIRIWHEGMRFAGTSREEEVNAHLEKASIILLLISADFLSSADSYSIMERALERYGQDEVRVIPILLRPVAWEGAPFTKLQILPRNGRPVAQWADRDEAYQGIALSIRQICNEFLLPSAQLPLPESTSTQRSPSQISPLYDVFVKSGTPTFTFVEPEDFEALQHSLAQPGRGVVIEGPSGVGKTSAIEKAIERLIIKRRLFQKKHFIELLSARDPDHRHRLQTLRQWHSGTVIVDDFHRLDPASREDLVDYLKYLADTSSKSRKLVIVGIPRTGQTLVDA